MNENYMDDVVFFYICLGFSRMGTQLTTGASNNFCLYEYQSRLRLHYQGWYTIAQVGTMKATGRTTKE